MSYAPPETWHHGDYPTAAKLNKYVDGMDAIHGVIGDALYNFAVPRRMGSVQGYYFVHRHRWLIYRDAGRIEDPAGIGETVSLSAADDGGWTTYDLDQVDWLIPGKLYQVQAVVACTERPEAL